MDDAIRQVELELDADGTQKFFHATLSKLSEKGGYELTTRTGKVGSKGRSTTKQLRSQAEADKAWRKAVDKKFKEGYFAADGYPPVAEFDETAVERDDVVRLVAAPRSGSSSLSVRRTPPPQLDGVRRQRGFHYADLPDQYGLWSPGRLHVGRRHDYQPVEPALPGTFMMDCYPRMYGLDPFPARPDAAAALVVHGAALYELELASATATKLHAFADPKTSGRLGGLLYSADGSQILWADGSTLVALERGGDAPRPVFELPGQTPIKNVLRLHTGGFALVQESQLTVLDAAFAPTHRLPFSRLQYSGSWLDGRVIVLGKDTTFFRHVWLLAVDDEGGVHTMPSLETTITNAYDHRGWQWLEVYGGGSSSPHRAFNVEAAWQRACQTPALAADEAVDMAPLHDGIKAMRDPRDARGFEDIVAMLDEAPRRLDLRSAGRTPLGDCAWWGETEVTRLLIERGAELDGIDTKGYSPLARAFERGHLEVADLLIDAGAAATLPITIELGGKALQTESPLVAAARGGYQEHIERMLERHPDADLDATGVDGTTALVAAMKGRHAELASMLIERGASTTVRGAVRAAVESQSVELARRVIPGHPEVEGTQGAERLRAALLSLSVKSVEPEVVDVLLEAGAMDTDPKSLHYAIDAAYVPAVRALLAGGADPQAPCWTANAPSLALSRALFTKTPHMGVVEALLDGGASLEAIDDRKLKALDYAIANSPLDVLTLLLDRGAPIARGESNLGPIHQAARAQRLEVLELLHERGADLDETTAFDLSALAIAVHNGRHESLRWLLDHGARVDGGDFTALMNAACKGDVEAIDLLAQHGADLTREAVNPYDQKDSTARTAAGHAERAGKTAALTRLRELAGDTAVRTPHEAIETGDLDALRRLLDDGADVDGKGPRFGLRPLHVAAGRSVEAIELLLERGAEVDVTNDGASTPLLTAAYGKGDDALARVEALLAAGANAAHTDDKGVSALDIAVSQGNLATVRRLIDAGCPVERKGAGKTQPLHIAARANDADLVRVLLDAGARVDPVMTTIHGGKHTPLHEAAVANAVAAAELLCARGANVGAGGDVKLTSRNEHDEVLYAEGGFTPIHRAAENGHFEVLVVLLRHDTRGARHLPIARGTYANELAEDHPRCHALLEAVLHKKTSVDDWLEQQRQAAIAAQSAEASGSFYIEQTDEPISEGTGKAPDAVLAALGTHDWVRTTHAGKTLVLRFVRGLYEVAVGDDEGVHDLATTIRAARVPYHIAPDGKHILVTDGNAVFAVDTVARQAFEVLRAEAAGGGKITQVGALGGPSFFVVIGDRLQHHAGPDSEPSWTLPAGNLEGIYATGSALVGLVMKTDVLRTVWAHVGDDGLRLHSRLDDRTALLWTRSTDDRGLEGVSYSSFHQPRVYQLHHLDGAEPGGKPLTALPTREQVDALPHVLLIV